MLPWGNTFTDPPHAHGRLTGELVAFIQDQRRELHVLEGRDVTWWDERGALREDRQESSSIRSNSGVALRQHQFAALPLVPLEYTAFLYLPR